MIARDNPFRSERIEALRYRLDRAGWAALEARFAAHGRRGVLVGPHGSGKTTLREEFEVRLRQQGWAVHGLVLHDDRPIDHQALEALASRRGAILVIDGLDRLGAWTWWRLHHRLRHAGGILATSHHEGRLPTLHRHTTDPALLADLVRELVGNAIPLPNLAALHQRHHGDLRACLRSLYDTWAGMS